jgi:hypothetical protein
MQRWRGELATIGNYEELESNGTTPTDDLDQRRSGQGSRLTGRGGA